MVIGSQSSLARTGQLRQSLHTSKSLDRIFSCYRAIPSKGFEEKSEETDCEEEQAGS